jgi:hypothetical protein
MSEAPNNPVTSSSQISISEITPPTIGINRGAESLTIASVPEDLGQPQGVIEKQFGNPEQEHVSDNSIDAQTQVDEVDQLIQDIRIQDLKRDAQLREINPDVVHAYTEAMKNDEIFPPVVAFRDEENNLWLADGFQRIEAATSMGLKTFFADIRTGRLDDARWHSYGANKTNAYYRSNKIKRRAVDAALGHPKAAKMSNIAIAKHVGVSEGLVRRVKDERAWDQSLSSNETKIREVNRNGTTYEQDVTQIGRPSGPVVLPNPERSLRRIYEILPKAIEALHDIEESVAGGSTFPMPAEDRIEAITAMRDGLETLIRWKTHPPSGWELQDLKRAVGARKIPKAQASAGVFLRMPPAAASTGMGSGGAALAAAQGGLREKRSGNSYAKPKPSISVEAGL